ncbi:HD family phosphohydrolase [Desulfocarbo indianensis]|nr:HD family phosphohydrolase [Desulfocarbo indianensis]
MISVEIHQFAESLGNAIDAKDHFTRLHSEEVAVVAHILALAYGLSPAQAEHIHIAGHLHDIGKIGIADHILQKPGPLNAAEWEEIKLHPLIGANIIRPVGFLAASGVADMVYHHHERYDGLGYPEGLRGEAIPLGARIIALADGLSAMLQDRPYRAKLTFRQAVDEIMQSRETYYDPKVVQAFSAESDAIRAALISMGES